MTTKPSKQPKRGDGQSMPVQTRSADISSVNEDDRSFELVWTTGAKVRRYDWWHEEYYDEELIVSDNAVDLTRLNNGAPLLDMHSGWSLRSILGVVEKAWVAAGEGLARVRFPRAEDNPDADRIFRMIKDKIIRNVSVGYRVNRIERERQDDGLMLYRVVDWQPFEISIVTVPADAGAGIRSEDQTTYPVIFVDRAAPDLPSKESPMVDENTQAPAQAEPTNTRTTPVTPTPPAAPAADPAPANPAPAEQARSWSVPDMTKITARAAAFGLSADIALEVMGTARNLEEATDALQARAATGNAPRQTAQTRVLTDEGDTKRRAIEVAVLHRANQNAVQLTDAAREYRGMSLLEMGRAYLEDTQGIRLRGLNKRELASTVLGIGETRAGMMSTSDFPKLLGNVVGARLRDAYGTAVKTWPVFCRQNNAPDFKERAIVQLAGIPEFKKVREGGEYSYAKLGESSEKYALGTYGRMIAITRQTLINDDLGAFDRLPTLFGRAAAELENDIVWGIILDNPKMGDGNALFHADHGNLAAADVPSETSLEAMDIAMGEQKGAEGKPLNLRPKFLIVSRKHKVTAQKLLTSVTATKTGDVNVYQNSLDLIVEDRLYVKGGVSPWLTVVDPATWDTIEYSYLEGEQGLYTEERVGFDVDGIEIKGRLDFAAKAIDWRGFQKNPGKA